MPRRSMFFPTIAALICAALFVGFAGQAAALGPIEVVKAFNDAGQLPEGIAIDKVGNTYVSMGFPFWFGGGFGQVWKIGPDGAESLLVDIPGGPAPAGLAVDAPGNLYYALPTGDPFSGGVYRVVGGGGAERLPGTERMILENGLAFDQQGNLYATDSAMGAVWLMPRGGEAEAEIWFLDDVLAGCADTPFGANGIAYWKRTLLVANTARGLLVRIPIELDGSAGIPQIVAGSNECDPAFDELDTMDGIALDAQGNVYAALVIQNRLVRINPDNGSITTLLSAQDGLFNPASIAFGTGRANRRSIFLTNFALLYPAPPNSLGPAVLKVKVGVPGWPLP